MRRVMARLAYTSILIALVATCASAQAQQQGGGSAAQIMSSIPANAVTITHWYKQSVYDPNDSKIGEIMDVLVDREGKATALIVGVGGFLGMGEKELDCLCRSDEGRIQNRFVLDLAGDLFGFVDDAVDGGQSTPPGCSPCSLKTCSRRVTWFLVSPRWA
jgi:PRC-barrel domain protein